MEPDTGEAHINPGLHFETFVPGFESTSSKVDRIDALRLQGNPLPQGYRDRRRSTRSLHRLAEYSGQLPMVRGWKI